MPGLFESVRLLAYSRRTLSLAVLSRRRPARCAGRGGARSGRRRGHRRLRRMADPGRGRVDRRDALGRDPVRGCLRDRRPAAPGGRARVPVERPALPPCIHGWSGHSSCARPAGSRGGPTRPRCANTCDCSATAPGAAWSSSTARTRRGPRPVPRRVPVPRSPSSGRWRWPERGRGSGDERGLPMGGVRCGWPRSGRPRCRSTR